VLYEGHLPQYRNGRLGRRAIYAEYIPLPALPCAMTYMVVETANVINEPRCYIQAHNYDDLQKALLLHAHHHHHVGGGDAIAATATIASRCNGDCNTKMFASTNAHEHLLDNYNELATSTCESPPWRKMIITLENPIDYYNVRVSLKRVSTFSLPSSHPSMLAGLTQSFNDIRVDGMAVSSITLMMYRDMLIFTAKAISNIID
jgi:hypothetical protein